jgi:hypothetical protein
MTWQSQFTLRLCCVLISRRCARDDGFRGKKTLLVEGLWGQSYRISDRIHRFLLEMTYASTTPSRLSTRSASLRAASLATTGGFATIHAEQAASVSLHFYRTAPTTLVTGKPLFDCFAAVDRIGFSFNTCWPSSLYCCHGE